VFGSEYAVIRARIWGLDARESGSSILERSVFSRGLWRPRRCALIILMYRVRVCVFVVSCSVLVQSFTVATAVIWY